MKCCHLGIEETFRKDLPGRMTSDMEATFAIQWPQGRSNNKWQTGYIGTNMTSQNHDEGQDGCNGITDEDQ